MADEQTTFDVHLVTPEQKVWSGAATFLVARSAGGDVGILPGHEQMLSVLGIGVVKIERAGDEALIAACDGGFLSVGRTPSGETEVNILAEHVSLQADIERSEIESLERRAEELRSVGDTDAARVESARAAARRLVTD